MADRPPLTDDEQNRRRQMIREMMPETPYLGWLGVVVETYEPDHAVARLPFREDLTNDGTYYHGGVIASMIDTTGALAAWSNHDFDKGARAATVSIAIQYVGACKKSDLTCEARAIKRGKELTFCEISAADNDGNIVAHGMLTYRIV